MKKTLKLFHTIHLHSLPNWKKIVTGFLFSVSFTFGNRGAFAQDVHFSQSNMTPLLVNPALTGVYGGTHRAFLNYKNQWRGAGIQGAAFNTGVFSYDAALLKGSSIN